MIASKFLRFAIAAFAASSLLAGCGGNTNVAPSLGAAPATIARTLTGNRVAMPNGAALPSQMHSWMAPNASKQQLLYVDDEVANTVDVFSYPSDTLLGTLTGFSTPQGMCVDTSGDVFIADFNDARVHEYAHGEIVPKATLQDPGYSVASCAFDPTTGNLAVTNFAGTGSPGNVALYKGAAGQPIAYYSAPSLDEVFFCDYDASGNLWVDGLSSGGDFDLAELKKGAKQFTHIYVNQTIGRPGAVQWVGNYLAIGDLSTNVVYRFLLTGDKATSVGGVTLSGATDIGEYLVQSGKIIGPDYASTDFGIWKFPAGGTVLKTVGGFMHPFGAVISTAKT